MRGTSAARALSLAPTALALAVQLSAWVLAVLALAASVQAAQVLVISAGSGRVGSGCTALDALAGWAGCAWFPKLLPVSGLARCWLWPGSGPLTCSLSCFGPGRLADWTVQKLSQRRLPTTRG